MPAPSTRFILKDTTGDEIVVSYVHDDERLKDSRCYIEFVDHNLGHDPVGSIDMALDPDMLEKLTDHLNAVWQELTRDRTD